MSQSTQNYIRESSRFYGKYEVVTPQGVIPCHNLSTARSYIEGTREHAIMQRQSQSTAHVEVPSIECLGFVAPSGQHYAVVEMPDMDIRIDCHNSATLRGWIKNGVSFQALYEALQDETNVRPTGQWCG
jgi:hypothetical protein